MRLTLTKCGTYKRFDGLRLPDSFTLFRAEVLHPLSIEDQGLDYPDYRRSGRWYLDVSLPSWLPTEGDGYVGLTISYGKTKWNGEKTDKAGFWITLIFGRFHLGWASEDVGKPSLFTNRFGFSYCSCFATGIGG